MLLAAVRTGKQMMPPFSAAAFTDGIHRFAMRFGDAIPEALQVLIAMVTEYLLNPIHESTPRINWLSFSRERASPSCVTCR